jgi:hypothetical protein
MDFGVVDEQTTEYVGGMITRDVTLATSSVNVTGIGFRPKAIQGWTADLSGIDTRCHFGFQPIVGGSNSQGLTNHRAGTPGNWLQSDQFSIWQTSSGNNVIGTVTSFDVDGFTIEWVKSGSPTANTIGLRYICYR